MFILPVDDDLNLVLLQSCHAEALFQLYERNRSRFELWMPYLSHQHSAADTRTFILEWLARFGNERGVLCGMWHGGALAGEVSVRIRDTDNASLAYVIDKDFEGRGLVTRSVRAITQYAFDVWKQRRIELRCSPENLRSQAVAERAGFTKEGFLRQYIEVNGVVQDMLLYSRLASDEKENGRKP
jgi:ribosomal-protein-serine acetyltransferase